MATLHSLVDSFHLSLISSRDGLSGGLLLSSVGETEKVVRFVYNETEEVVRFVYNKALGTPSMIVSPSTILLWPHVGAFLPSGGSKFRFPIDFGDPHNIKWWYAIMWVLQ